MQRFKNPAGQVVTDAGYACEFFYAGFSNALNATKMRQQCPASARANAGNFLEHRVDCGLLAATTMSGDGETVRFIPDLLNQMRGG